MAFTGRGALCVFAVSGRDEIFGRILHAEAGVGQVLEFSRGPGGEPASSAPKAGGAQILIFTGVRYEREPEPRPNLPATPAGSRRRG